MLLWTCKPLTSRSSRAQSKRAPTQPDHSVAWVQAHQEEAHAIANRSADLMEEVLSSDGLLEYATSLWRGYATLATKYEHPRDHDFSSRIHLAANFVRFTCDTPLVHKAWVTTCRFIG